MLVFIILSRGKPMGLEPFFQGIFVGFSVAAPLGPVGILCIQRTLTKGRVNGLFSGFGAATADTVYGMIAGFGLTFISDMLIAAQFWLRLAGGLFLCYLGARTLVSKPDQKVEKPSGASLRKDYGSTFFLTLSNPMTVLFFAAVFVGLGAGAFGDYANATFFSTGIFSGSMLWWFILTSATVIALRQFDLRKLQIINLASGFIVCGFGVYLLLTLILR